MAAFWPAASTSSRSSFFSSGLSAAHGHPAPSKRSFAQSSGSRFVLWRRRDPPGVELYFAPRQRPGTRTTRRTNGAGAADSSGGIRGSGNPQERTRHSPCRSHRCSACFERNRPAYQSRYRAGTDPYQPADFARRSRAPLGAAAQYGFPDRRAAHPGKVGARGIRRIGTARPPAYPGRAQ
jgi:hypothetical protein